MIDSLKLICKVVRDVEKRTFLISILVIPLLLILGSCKKTEEDVLYDFTSRFWDAQTVTHYRSQNLFHSWNESDRMFGWNRNRKQEQNAILIPRQKEKALFRFGCLEKKDTKLAFNVRSMISSRLEPPPFFDVTLNGHKIFSSFLNQKDYQRVVVNAKKEFLHIGENILEFRRSSVPENVDDRHWLALRQFVFGNSHSGIADGKVKFHRLVRLFP